ncbi:head-tail adaptor protein [Paracandidimonas soli]|uniref:SPP1 family predicted phage head-tail adaptor n=1 Tax=Paracandidimonas soli TaxID=1917182 RepID=A0A4R3UTE2_9BURK|nr:head-tail adaptor protein [Paracandidimonas soli]TCU93943.1 SPP1 family predicted phage head-tail adaptor [Paracandidimonas soli]
MKSRSGVSFPFPESGELDRKVLIRLRSDRPSGYASLVAEYPDNVRRWASLRPVGTAVWSASVQTDERVTHRCIVRYMQGITTDHEVVSRGRLYAVRRCADLQGAGEFLVMDVEEIGDAEVLT